MASNAGQKRNINIENPSCDLFCELCENEITKFTKILDTEANLFLCLKCFADGREDGKRKKDSRYIVVNKINFPLISADWTGEEELRLLDGLERCGFGNWEEISKNVETKNKFECESHYEEEYISRLGEGQTGLLKITPLTMKNQNTGEIVTEEVLESQKKKKTSNENAPFSFLGPEVNQGGLSNPKGSTGAPSESINEIVGFMPLRGDFDSEYDNDAELLLAEMEFGEDDTPEEIELKYKVLEIYNKRLDQRIKRKQFVIQHGLLNIRKQTTLDRLRSKEEKDIYNALKPFARFSTPEEHEKLIEGLMRERELRKRIEELSFYKRLGMKTFQDIENYLNEKKKKDEAYQKKQKSNENYVYDHKISSRTLSGTKRTRVNNKDFIYSVNSQ